ncbi:hypothetical protein CUMW_106800 [Citrus unshiu]|nr:hypothetical protein CUMW_106800 [Citrus unshiu]
MRVNDLSRGRISYLWRWKISNTGRRRHGPLSHFKNTLPNFSLLHPIQRNFHLLLLTLLLISLAGRSHISLHPSLQLAHVELGVFFFQHRHDALIAESNPGVILGIQPIIHISRFAFLLSQLVTQGFDLSLKGGPQRSGLSNRNFLLKLRKLLVQLGQLFLGAISRFSFLLQLLVVTLIPRWKRRRSVPRLPADLRTLVGSFLPTTLTWGGRGQSRNRSLERTGTGFLWRRRRRVAGAAWSPTTLSAHRAEDIVIHSNSNIYQARTDQVCWRQEVLASRRVHQSSFYLKQRSVFKIFNKTPRF